MTDPPSEREIAERAQGHAHQPLTPAEYEALMHFRAQWAELVTNAGTRFFVLGSFADADVDRVNDLKSTINDFSADCVAYRMDDFLEDIDLNLNSILKFKLIADGSDYILGVCEHDKGGQLIEHGLLIESRSYIQKARLLKRTYPPDLEKQRYSWMQSLGVFEIFDYYGQLYEWETVPEYQSLVEGLVDDLV
ncbi:hypothetical protein ACOZ4N_00125 (plasmid) [Halorientalis pallida]|uniref:hypothetical protein n=1 Tax=Halorientalis pallida TaxID=2479928 RepID=UPI003C703519